jgi:hypothetical protein
MAAQIRVFKVIGNSNIRNAFSTRLKLSEKISGQITEFVPAEAYSSGIMALGNLDGATTVLVNFLVNGLVDATELCSDLNEVDKVLQDKVTEYTAAIRMAASINTETNFFVMPPMTRTIPFWMETKLPAVVNTLTAQMQGFSNLIMLPIFNISTKDDLEADGVHLHRRAQARLFNYIMQAVFPGSSSVKDKNNTRERNDTDDEMDSPPPKRLDGKVVTDLPQQQLTTEIVTVAVTATAPQPIADPLAGCAQPEAAPPLQITASPSASAESISDISLDIANPDLQRLYQMLSKKIDTMSNVSIAVQARVEDVQVQLGDTSRQVERNTLLLRSLHLRTAAQAEVLDAHTNTLNLNFVMISGIPANLFSLPENELPGTKTVMEKLIKDTPFLVSGIKFAVYAKYIKHQSDKLPNIKACFINSDTALAFRDSANKLRVAKQNFWESVYVSNDPTKATRVRISILQALSKRLAPLPANSGKTIFVSRFDPKPQLCFKFGGRVEKRFDFVAAMEKYRTMLRPEDKEAARKVAGKSFSEDELRQFIVL